MKTRTFITLMGVILTQSAMAEAGSKTCAQISGVYNGVCKAVGHTTPADAITITQVGCEYVGTNGNYSTIGMKNLGRLEDLNGTLIYSTSTIPQWDADQSVLSLNSVFTPAVGPSIKGKWSISEGSMTIVTGLGACEYSKQ